jgi:hypothetical protein
MDDKSKERLLKNYYNARKSFEAYCFLGNIDLTNSNQKLRKYVDENDLLFYLRYLTLKDVHVELYKIIKYSKTSIDNIFKLLRNLNTNDSIAHLKKLNEHHKQVESITTFREKFYAHLDEDYLSLETKYPLKDIYTVFSLVEEAIIILGYEDDLNELLKTIPSRDEFEIKI